MAEKGTIRQGAVYWLNDCPPLGDKNTKRRPVVVVSTREMLEQETPVVVVAVSTSLLASDHDCIKLPNKQDNAKSTSGLPKRCWAVPRWFFLIEPEKLTEWAGYITGNTLRQLVGAVERRKDELRQRESRGT